jgi:NAD(P)-dependent dehydrogenase (short-subunit alcohol dehydrogenase family)
MLGFSNSFTADSIPDQTGRVVVVTGGNTGLGKQTIIAFARKGATVYMGARTESKAVRV